MASIIDDPNGLKRILFVDGNGKRRAIRLGHATMKQAEGYKLRVERLSLGEPDEQTLEWADSLDDRMHGRLAAVGLVKSRESGRAGLGAFIDAYIADRTDAKPRTIINLKQARKDLIEFFGPGKPLRDITEGDADEFWRHLLRRGLGQNTARRICGRAKQFFRVAIRKRLVTRDPFASLKSHVQGNRDRFFFITPAMAGKVIDACPDAQWRLIFALSRYGGLRCPSEHLALKWGDVDWSGNRFTVHSCKTEHHDGKESRQVPIFPELRPYLEQAFDEAEPGSEYIITRARDGGVNLRTGLQRIIERAGLVPWPKLFHNLRATRETELAEIYPIHVVCAWIGNSAAVAQEHYLQVTDEHFAQAAGQPVGAGKKAPAEKAAQNQAQYGAERQGMDGSHKAKSPGFPGHSASLPSTTIATYPLGESNPCPLAENQISWATRRRGHLVMLAHYGGHASVSQVSLHPCRSPGCIRQMVAGSANRRGRGGTLYGTASATENWMHPARPGCPCWLRRGGYFRSMRICTAWSLRITSARSESSSSKTRRLPLSDPSCSGLSAPSTTIIGPASRYAS